ncbi:MAG: glycosyltransferase family 2 protein [Saprospiraceae bacterium]|nr:glycosyltransferase family 2 protein [Saprospiraceae bacterium]
MKLGVILINWNHHERTLDAVEYIRKWRTIEPQIVVVDNRSRARNSHAYKKLKSSSLLLENDENLGFAGGNNVGVQKALELDVDYILLQNVDAVLPEVELIHMLRTLEIHPDIGVTGPVLQESQYSELHVGGKDIGIHSKSRISMSKDEVAAQQGPLAVDYVPGTAFLVRSSIFKECGLLEEAYFFSGSIADFCYRIRQDGWRCCIDPKATARHDNMHFGGYRDSLYLYYSLRNRFLYISKNHSIRRHSLRMKWLMMGLNHWLGAAIHGKKQQARAVYLGLRDGWIGKFGNQNHYFISD